MKRQRLGEATARAAYHVWAERQQSPHIRCANCGDPWPQDWHHAIPKSKFPAATDDARGLVPLCRLCHERHERAFRRLPRSILPAAVFDLARELGPQAVAYIERTYPDNDSEAVA